MPRSPSKQTLILARVTDNRCPHCGKDQLYPKCLASVSGTKVVIQGQCFDCKKKWEEVYKLVGVELNL